MSTQFRKASMLVVAGSVAFVLVGYVHRNADQFRAMMHLSVSHAMLLVALSGAYLLLQGLILRRVCRARGVDLRTAEHLGIQVLGMLGNYFLPFAGVGFRAKYLNAVHKLSYSDFAVTSYAIVIVELLVFASGGLACLGWLWFTRQSSDPWIVLGLGITVIGIGAAYFLVPRSPRASMGEMSQELVRSWGIIRTDRALARDLTGLNLLLFVTNTAMYCCAFTALGWPARPDGAGVVASVSDLSFLFRIAPAAFGTYEAAVAYSARLCDLTVVQSLLAAGLMRATTLIWLCVTGPFFSLALGQAASPGRASASR